MTRIESKSLREWCTVHADDDMWCAQCREFLDGTSRPADMEAFVANVQKEVLRTHDMRAGLDYVEGLTM